MELLAAINASARGLMRPYLTAGADADGDEALMERVRAGGDAEAFSRLVTRYRARVVGLARRLLSEAPDEAEDVAQDAFLAAYDKRAGFRRGEAFRPWLYQIVVHRCLDRLRARKRRPPPADIGAVTEPAQSGSDPLRHVLGGERDQQLDEAVAALPPPLRAVLLLRHGDDLSYEEIAQAMRLPVGTVKTHLFRARARLRESLAGYFEP